MSGQGEFGSAPQQPPASGGGGTSAMASGKVAGPAIALMVISGIGMFFAVLGILFQILGISLASLGGFGGGGEQQNALASMFAGTLGIVIDIIAISIGGFIIFAALKMKNLESYSMAMAASILAMIPCISPCCILGLPIGIWAIVVLVDPNVKASFRA